MPLPQKVNVKRALAWKMKGMSYQQIADDQGVDKSTVHANIAHILKELTNPDTVEFYRKEQAQIIDGIAAKTVAHITNEKLENASFRDLCVGMGILIDKSRLVQGQATQNLAMLVASSVSDAWGGILGDDAKGVDIVTDQGGTDG